MDTKSSSNRHGNVASKNNHTSNASPSNPQNNFSSYQNIPPSSPPASPPRYRRTHSNSLSQSLSESFNPDSVEAKSVFLASSVLRSYPPAQLNNSRAHRSTINSLTAPPSPPESVLISQSVRPSRSTSTATASTIMPLALSPAAVIEPMSLREKLNKALPFRKISKLHTQHDAEMHVDPELERTPSLTLTTTHSPSYSLPTTGQNSADTAHRIYSNSFPVPHFTDSKAPSLAGSDDSFDLPTYYNASVSRSKEPSSHRTSGRRSTFTGEEQPRQLIVRGGEVRIDIRRPSPVEDTGRLHRSRENIVQHDGSNDNHSRHGAFGSAVDDTEANGSAQLDREGEEDWFVGKTSEYQKSIHTSIPIQDAGLCIKGLQHRPAFKNLKHPSESSSIVLDNQHAPPLQCRSSTSDDSEQIYLEAVDHFNNHSPENKDVYDGNYEATNLDDEYSETNSPLSGNEEIGELTPAKASSSVLPNVSLNSLRSKSSVSRSPKPWTGSRNDSSSSGSAMHSRNLRRPDLNRVISGENTSITNATRSSSIDIEEAENVVASMSVELSKRLSGMSSSGGSQRSGNGSDGFGAGLAIVVTTDENGGLSDIRSRLIEASEGESEDHGGSENSSKGELRGAYDKGKGKMQDSIEGSGSSNSEQEKGTQKTDLSVENRYNKDVFGKDENIAIHPADDRYDYVYRLRAASPDNQPILIPHYKYPYPSGSFPNRNALTMPKPIHTAPVLIRKEPTLATLSEPIVEDNESIRLPDALYFTDSLTKESSFPSCSGRSGRSRRDLLRVGGDGAADPGPSSLIAEYGSSSSEGISPHGAVAHVIASSAGLFSLGTGASTQSNPYVLPKNRNNLNKNRISLTGQYSTAEFSTPKRKMRLIDTAGPSKRQPNHAVHISDQGPQGTPASAMSSLRRLGDMGKRYFVNPSPHLYRLRTVEKNIRPTQDDIEQRTITDPYPMTPEVIALQRKWSWLLFALCSVFFPFLLILGYGGMDSLIMSWTDGQVETVGDFQKRLALWSGYVFGAVTIGVVVGIGIAVGFR